MNSYIHSNMQDELAESVLLDQFQWCDLDNEFEQKWMVSESKYNRPDGGTNRVKLNANESVCMIVRESTGGVALYHRTDLGQIVKIDEENGLAMTQGGVIRVATPDDERIVGWQDWAALDTMAKRKMKDAGRHPFSRAQIDQVRILFTVTASMTDADVEQGQRYAIREGRSILQDFARARQYKQARDQEGHGSIEQEEEKKEELSIKF